MKILVLNGSPKREKSDTLHLTKAFLEWGMVSARVQVTVEDHAIKEIKLLKHDNGGEHLPKPFWKIWSRNRGQMWTL